VCRPLFLAALLLGAAAPPLAPAETPAPVEAARTLLRAYHEDPARLDRARELLEAHLIGGDAPDVPTLLVLARTWFLTGDVRAHTEADRIAAYARGRDYARRATVLAPDSAAAHLWYAITLGSWAKAKGLLRSALTLREVRREVDTVLRLEPANIQAHIMAGSMARELPALFGGDHQVAEAHFKTARRLDPHRTGVRIELAQLYIDMGRYGEARQELDAVLAEPAPTDRPRWTLKEVPRARRLLESIRDKQ
jgi:tetratricopeptide (TPR) repeat protein